MLNQTVADLELIIINDGSTDRSEDVILAFQDPPIR
ncbi:glycosyltransferase family A protein [Bacillus sp. ISL-39]